MEDTRALIEGVNPRKLFLEGENYMSSKKIKGLAVFESNYVGMDEFKTLRKEKISNYPEEGYELWKEYSKALPEGIISAYTTEGKYIGSKEKAEFLCVKMGLYPDTYGDNKVCSIGFNKEKQSWHGWSHRAFSPPFTIGYTIENENNLCCFSGLNSDYLKEHPEEDHSLPVGFKAKSLDDCKLLAIAFAAAVD